jgi:hypothetical protein
MPASGLIRARYFLDALALLPGYFPLGDGGHSLDLLGTPEFVAKMPQITRKVHGMRELLSNTRILSPRGYSQLSPFHLSRAHRFVIFSLQGAMS